MNKLDLIIDALESAHYTNDTSVMGLTKLRHTVAIAAARELKAELALNKKADNARELGLDYEPEQEPVGYFRKEGDVWYEYETGTPLYALGESNEIDV